MPRNRPLLPIVLTFLTAAGAAGAQTPPAPIEIGAPGVLDKPGATYLLTRDVTAAKTAFMIKADGITLDLGGRTVTYGTAVGVDRCSGVFLRPAGGESDFPGVPAEGFGGGNRFTLRNGRIVQGRQPVAPDGAITYSAGRMVKETGDHPRPGRHGYAVYVRGCEGLEITGVTTDVNSRDSDNLYIRDCAGVRIHGNHCLSSVREITNRHWPGTGVITVVGVSGPVEVDHNIVDGGGQWGIRVSGGREPTGHLVDIHHNVLRHRSYTTNGYALGCSAPNMRVHANVIVSVGRGAHLSGPNLDFFNNIVQPRERPNPEYPRTRTHGIKLEGTRGSRIHHNFCRVVADEGFGDASPLDFSVDTHSANQVYKNTFIALRNTPKLDAYSVNLYSVEPDSMTLVHDNVFKTNHIHFRGDWGGVRGFTFARNRFEVVGQAPNYVFFLLAQSTASQTCDMAFRDNALVPPADYRKVRMLYAPRYGRAQVDMAVQWTVTARAIGPAGVGVGGVTVEAIQADRPAAWSLTDGDGIAELVLGDVDIVGNFGKDPIADRGPCELVFSQGQREIGRRKIDPTGPAEMTVTVADPQRKLYVNAGPDQRHETGETAPLNGKVVVLGDPSARPEVTWRIVRGKADWPIANAHSAMTTAEMKVNAQCTLELSARLGEETATDTMVIRTDTHATPTAVARAPRTAEVNTLVQLDASASRDPRGFPADALSYRWRQTAGPPIDLSSNELPAPIFYPIQPGTYIFELVFANPIRASKPATCIIEVTPTSRTTNAPKSGSCVDRGPGLAGLVAGGEGSRGHPAGQEGRRAAAL